MIKNKNIVIIVLCIIITLLTCVIFIRQDVQSESRNNEMVSYEDFLQKANRIFKHLSNKYNFIGSSNYSVVIGYFGNVKHKWAKGDSDTIDEDPFKPMKIENYIVNNDKTIFTKIGIYYTPQINERQYIKTSIIHEMTNDYLNEKLPLSPAYSTSFTDSGMVIEISCFAINKSVFDEDIKELLGQISDTINSLTIEIQEYLLTLD